MQGWSNFQIFLRMLRRGGLPRLASGEENGWEIAQSFRVENQEKWVEVELPASLNNWQMIRKSS
jgi:hypothetical protein